MWNLVFYSYGFQVYEELKDRNLMISLSLLLICDSDILKRRSPMGFSETTRGSLKLLRLWSTPSMFNDLWQILARQEYTNVGSKYMIGYSRHSSHLSIWGGGGDIRYFLFSGFYFLFLFHVSFACFYLLFIFPVFISCFFFLFIFPVLICVSISCFNYQFLFPV